MQYRKDIDAIKGLAIIAVIFYHIGMFPNGYLGVDAFLVINGYLIIPSMVGKIQYGEFNYGRWLLHRLYRLWPIVIAASIISMIIGYFVMIPDSYENLAESVVASNLFSNNILSAITTRNYWDSANEFKPLMQMWYLGVVVQFYVIFPLLCMLIAKLFKNKLSTASLWQNVLIVSGIVSLGLYIFYPTSYSDKFYFVQYRWWEFMVGGLIGYILSDFRIKNKMLSYLGYFALVSVMTFGIKSISEVDTWTIIGMSINAESIIIKTVLPIIITAISGFLLLTKLNIRGGILCYLGKISLSLFVWHQVILAFVRYSYSETLSWHTLILYLIVTVVISIISYYSIERIKLSTMKSQIIFFVLLFGTTGIAFAIYRNAGVVRDVPELGVTLDDPLSNRNTEYTDQIYQLQKPFETEKKHVLVIGNSFARDFACIIKEYDKDESLELSYRFSPLDLDSATIAKTDYLFVFGSKSQMIGNIENQFPAHCKMYGISTKCFGKNFGIFYARRNEPDYFLQAIKSPPLCDSINNRWRAEWGDDNFIDLVAAAKNEDGKVRIFTPDHEVISFDCRHLTKAGCIFYSTRIGLDTIFSDENIQK